MQRVQTFVVNNLVFMKKLRAIAFYLPQYHPFKENDEWWGAGFTEWRNVTKAQPRYRGHYQPHLPADLGFYDLRIPEVRDAQARLALEYGIYGFCYYHYWFNGHLLMEKPLNEVLKNQKPNFPFMICWANENWTRAWDGGEKQILIKQNYSDDDDRIHIQYLLENIFCDSRYIRVQNKPVFAVYRSTAFPNMKRTIEIWREEAYKKNVELYLCRVESSNEYGEEYLDDGFDSAIEFPPHNRALYLEGHNLFSRGINKLSRSICGKNIFQDIILYKDYVDFMCNRELPNYKLFPAVTPMWDNSPRRKDSFFAFRDSTPELYQKWLTNVVGKFTPYTEDENFIFINAWNEWAEGNHLEPDLKWGRQYLEATRNALCL